MKQIIALLCFLSPISIVSQNTEVNIKESNIGINITKPEKFFHIEVPASFNENGLYSKINYNGTSDLIAIEGYSITNQGYGIGGYFTGGWKGIHAKGDGETANSGFPTYGIYAEAVGSAGTRIGLFSKASGGDKNIAARFGEGDVDIYNNVYIGNPTDSLARLNVSNENNLHNNIARAGYFVTKNDGDEDTYGISTSATSNGSGNVYAHRNLAFGFEPSSKVYGLYSTAVGANGEMIGIYSSAAGGIKNLAALFGSGDVEVQSRLRVNTINQNGRVHIKNTDNIGSNATAIRIEADNNGPETSYGTFVTATNSGTGNAIGHYSAVYTENDLAYRGDGNVYFTGDLRVGQNVDPYDGVYKVVVDGKILSEEVRVQNSLGWPDYVFDKNYKLRSLKEVENFIKKYNHLPNIPSAKKIEQEGIILGEMQTRMMEKIEELTLYILAQQKEIDQIKSLLKDIKNEK